MISKVLPKVTQGEVTDGAVVDAIGQQWCVSHDRSPELTILYLWYRKSKTAQWRQVFALQDHSGRLSETEHLEITIKHLKKDRVYRLRISEYVHSVPNEVAE